MNSAFADGLGRAYGRAWDDRRRCARRGGQPVLDSLLHVAGMAGAADPRMLDLPGDKRGPHAGLPLADLGEIPTGPARYYTASSVDDRGRLADRTPLKIMAWGPDAPVRIETMRQAGVILVRPGGPDAVTAQGFLRLSSAVRYDCRIGAGERLLVVADARLELLAIYTPYAVDAMSRAYLPGLGTDHGTE